MGVSKIDYNQIPDGNDNFPISVSLKGFVPFTGGSGRVPTGNFVLEYIRQRLESKKGEGKAGKNLHGEFKVVEPAEFAGVPIHAYDPAPLRADASDTGYNKIQSLIWAMSSYAGTLETAMQQDNIDVKAGGLKGKRFCVRLEVETYKEREQSKIARYISKEEYTAAPGPDKTLPQQATSSPKQTTTPELFGATAQQQVAAPANGTGATPPDEQKPIANVLFQ